MSIKVSFDLNDPSDFELVEELVRGRRALRALAEVREHIFRPARKHGYQIDSPLHKFYNNVQATEVLVTSVIAAGEEIFNNILEEENLLRD